MNRMVRSLDSKERSKIVLRGGERKGRCPPLRAPIADRSMGYKLELIGPHLAGKEVEAAN
ncbi:hypothetical protein AMTR_s04916p00003880 [Amborella trichopoda]|uniref:Uncharacterized protein n=1 Tax=Amborella trichopoda TaxID=13333 RepID=U5CKG7_AMBTC|nr:hypothetical protein AMTR_s04916p00003880 [Amborella trichopoda]